MATVYTADDYTNPLPNSATGGVVLVRPFKWTIPILIINDSCKLCVIPSRNGIVLLDLVINVSDIDAATSLTLDVGDDDDPNRFVAGSTKGQGGGIISYQVDGVTGSLPRTYAGDGTAANMDDNNLVISVLAAAGTAATGVLTGFMRYVQEDTHNNVYPLT